MASNLHASLLPIIEKGGLWGYLFVAEKGSTSLQNGLFEHNAKVEVFLKGEKQLNFAPKPSLRFSTTNSVLVVTSQSLRGYFAVTSRSQHGHYAVTTVTTRSLRGHYGHYAVTTVTT